MSTVSVKRGDTAVDLLYTVKVAGVAFDHSDPKWLVQWSMRLDADPTVQVQHKERDVTAHSKTNGDPSIGEVSLPLWDGRTTTSGTQANLTVADQSIDGTADVDIPIDPDSEVDTQELYMTRAGEESIGPFFKVASGVNGFADGTPVRINISDVNLALGLNIHSDDQSATNANSALPTPQTPAPVLAGVGAGNLDDGVHGFAVVSKRETDVDTAALFQLEIILFDQTTGRPVTFPEKGFELLDVTEDI